VAVDPQKTGVVVVTRNRRSLLRRCLAALAAQTTLPGSVLVVDNAGSDGSGEMIRSEFPAVRLIRLEENVGGAGGFCAGMQAAIEAGCSWLWIMDDDCFPETAALENLTAAAEEGAVYGSITLSESGGDGFASGSVILKAGAEERKIGRLSDITGKGPFETVGIGFGGLFISREAVRQAGLPRKDFFVYADDSEYSRRIRLLHGMRMFYVPDSVIRHPALRIREITLLGRKVPVVESAPWKAYYNIRNQTYVTRLYNLGPAAFFLSYLPRQAVFLALRAFFIDDGERFRRFFLYMKALFDGALGRMGKRDFKEV
jgi:GT2 family glycosyltransferase